MRTLSAGVVGLAISTWALTGCGSTALDAGDGGRQSDAGSDGAVVLCAYAGNSHPAGSTFPALDGCNTCSCGADGQIACTLLGCEPPATPDAGCAFDYGYQFWNDGGRVAYADRSTLAPPRTHQISRDTFMNAPPATCSREVPCAPGAAGAAVDDVLRALQDPDVVQALGLAAPPFYGTDDRPVDGSIFMFQRDDGRGFWLGSGAVPAGLRALQTLLGQLATSTLASPECADLPSGR